MARNSKTTQATTVNKASRANPATVKVLILAVVDACRESVAASQLAGQALAGATRATQEALDAILQNVVPDPRKPDPTKSKACYQALDKALVAAGLPDSTTCRRVVIKDNGNICPVSDEARAAGRIAAALSQRLSRATKAAIEAACEDGRKTVRSGNMTPEHAEAVLTTRLQGIQMTDADKKALHDACRAGAGLTASPVAIQPQVTPKIASNLLASCRRIADTLPPREALAEVMRMLENALGETTNLPATSTPAETKARTKTRRKLKAA